VKNILVKNRHKYVPKIGLGRFAFRYAIGNEGFKHENHMNPMDFLIEAYKMGFECVQLCENLEYSKLNKEQLVELKEKADEFGIIIEIGMKGLTRENLSRHLEISRYLSSDFLRIVLGNSSEFSKDDEEKRTLIVQYTKMLREVKPYCEKYKLRIGIENHFDLTSEELVKLVDEIDSPLIGFVFDTTNALGFIEQPEVTLDKFKKRLFSVHLKDYQVKKVDAGYFITGAVLGEGLLDVPRIIGNVLNYNPEASIIIEMSRKKDESKTINEVLQWEKEGIKRSLLNLQKIIGQLQV